MRLRAVAFVLAFVAVTTTCANPSAASPASPSASATQAPGAAATPGSTISGTVVSVAGASQQRVKTAGLTVSVTGTSATTTVDATAHFTLHNVPAGAVQLHFTGTGVDARLALGTVADHSTVVVSVRVNGSTAALDDDTVEDASHNAQVEGVVTAASAGTLTVARTTIAVMSTTVIVQGGTPVTLASIHVGDRVHVQGTMAGTTIAATRVEARQGAETPGNDADPGGGQNGATVELSGTLSARSGTCPALTFTVSSTTVTTTATTQFEDTACSALANGDRVDIKGTRQASGGVAATVVARADN